jgi:hypothetical protein
MALNYTKFQLLAERLIGENGRTVTLVRRDQNNPIDIDKPWRGSTGASDISFDLIGVIIEYDKEDIDGTLVRISDQRLLIAAKDIEDVMPANELIEDYDEVIDGSVHWKIVKVGTVKPGAVRIMYDIQLR